MEKIKHMFHTSNPYYHDSILSEGLIPKVGNSYSAHHNYEDNLKPLVFLSEKPYDSTWDDDIWMVDVNGLKLQYDPDEYMSEVLGCRVYSDIILPYRLVCIWRGSGKSEEKLNKSESEKRSKCISKYI
jgi:hypothetical protein